MKVKYILNTHMVIYEKHVCLIKDKNVGPTVQIGQMTSWTS